MNKHQTIVARPVIGEIDFCGWLGQARPGDMIEYHRGFLALDTVRDGSRLPEKARAELARVAWRARWAAAHDLVHLLQRRNGPEDFSYLAIARERPKSACVSLSAVLAADAQLTPTHEAH